MTTISLSRVTDFAALGERWRALEQYSDCSFFQSWTWTGCLVEERFPDPILLAAEERGRTVALALFNRQRGVRQTLLLGETGDHERDTPFIEFNGILMARGHEALAAACLRAARQDPIDRRKAWVARRLVLSGVDDGMAAAARMAGTPILRRSRPAPWLDLVPLRQGADSLAGCSANTRYQIRRSDRAYAVEGPVVLGRADTEVEALAWLDELAALHQATWEARGQPGAFASPFFRRFHRALIGRALPRGELDLLRMHAGGRVIGLLYNLRHRGRLLSYQSGFNYPAAERHQKPGLTCHHQAIRFAAAAGLDRYDFLAGDDRYKQSLANRTDMLHWLQVGRDLRSAVQAVMGSGRHPPPPT